MKKTLIILMAILLLAGTTEAAQQVIDPDTDTTYRARWDKQNDNNTELYGRPSYGILQSDIDSWNAKQNRVSGTCSGSEAIQIINADGTVHCVAGGGGASTWLGLTDTPAAYTADYYVKVNSAGTGLELVTAPTGTGDVAAAANLANLHLVIGDGGAKGVKTGQTTEDASGNVTVNGNITVTGDYLSGKADGERYTRVVNSGLPTVACTPARVDATAWRTDTHVQVRCDGSNWVPVSSGGGSGDVTLSESATTPTPGSMAAGTLHHDTTDDMVYLQTDTGLLHWQGTFAANPATYTLNLTVTDTDGSGGTIAIGGTNYTAGTYAITGQSGTVSMTGTYGTGQDTLTWAGDTVAGSYPDYTIDMGTADKTITGTFTQAATADCANLGTWDFYYDVDHSAGTTTACVQSGTETGTFYGDMAASNTWNSTSGGTYSIVGGNTDDYIEFPANVTGDAGYVKMTVYAPTDQSGRSTLFEYTIDADNYISLLWRDGFGFRFFRNQAGTLKIINAGPTAIPTATSIVVEARWSVASDTCEIKVDGGSWVTISGIVSLTGTDPMTMILGEKLRGYGGQTMHMDDIYTSVSYVGGN